METSDSDSDADDALQADLLNLRRALGSAYRSVEENAQPQSSTPAAASAQVQGAEDETRSHPAGVDDPELKQLLSQRDSMQAALDANRALQNQLCLVKEQIEKFLHDNGVQTASIAQLRKNPTAGKGENPEGLGSSTMGPSRFWVHNNSVPEQNADTVALLPYYRYLPHRFDNPRRWSTADCEALRQHVLTIVKCLEFEAAQANSSPSRADVEESMTQQVHALTLTKPGVKESIEAWSDQIWETRISPLNGIPGNESQIHWFNHCCPSVNHLPWSTDEEESLVQLVEQNQKLNWEQVSNDLGTGRPPVACMMHFKTIEQRTRGQGRFSEAEEERLAAGLSLYGPNWPEIASHVGGNRNRQQVMHHYQNVMKPRRKGKWGDDEDKLLILAVSVVGEKKLKRWSSIADMVGGRTQTQCRERWCNVLDPDLKSGIAWSKDELSLLQDIVPQQTKEDGSVRWAAVAAQLPGRTDNEVFRQYSRLFPKSQEVGPARKRVKPVENTDQSPASIVQPEARATSPGVQQLRSSRQ